ncbi:MAG: beta-lactamase [Pseudonocardiales bacterium]|nr:beta-lactamase [Pseudonocardiales bacterium]
MTTRRLHTGDMKRIELPEQPVISPAGDRIAYVLRSTDTEADRVVRSLWLASSSASTRRLTHGSADTDPAWSPDGRWLAFLRGSADSNWRRQLWLLPVDGGEATAATDLPLGAGPPVWSPDATRIAFVADVDPDADIQVGNRPGTPPDRSHAPIVVDRLGHAPDGAGPRGSVRPQIHVLNIADRACRAVTEIHGTCGTPAWSADGAHLAFCATLPSPDHPGTVAGVFVAADGQPWCVPIQVATLSSTEGPVLWDPDGSALLVIGRASARPGHERLLRITLDRDRPDGSHISDITAALDRNVMAGAPAYPGAAPQLESDGRRVVFCIRDRGCTHLYSIDLAGGAPRPVFARAGYSVSGLSIAGSRLTTVLTTPTSFGEVVAVDLPGDGTSPPSLAVLTNHGDALGDVELFVRQDRQFTMADGTPVQGWLLRDPDAVVPQPLLLDIHGGPHNAWHGAADPIHLYHQELAAQGWCVLVLNPRGSDGYGEKHFAAVTGAWGKADADDFLQPLDELVDDGTADPTRLAVTGYSYGGFMTCYLTGHDHRFAAAVAGGVVTDLAAMAATSDEGWSIGTDELDGLAWSNDADARALSPITEVASVRTPTLLLHGADDLRCPPSQAQLWHSALVRNGVPTGLVLYPGGSHLFVVDGRPSHRLDYYRRTVEWVQRFAGDSAGPRPAAIDGAHWQRRLDILTARHDVPGATLGILRVSAGGPDERIRAASGVLNRVDNVVATPESLFQIGSITKVWTTTLVMQLLDEGRIELDAPLIEILPELRLANPEATAKVTMRNLLTHTSGIDGDVFIDTGRGDDCLEKYVDQLAEVPLNHPLGATWSYSNAAFALAGRAIEAITGQSWDRVLRERIIKPLGLKQTVTLAEDAIRHPMAIGHLRYDQRGLMPARQWMLPRSAGPAGLVASTVDDVLSFARLHLAGGVTTNGCRLLSAESARAMTDNHAQLPDTHTYGDSWGLGWSRYDWDGHRLIGHDGGTIGQAAFLRILPEAGLAAVLLTNGGNAGDLFRDLFDEIFGALAGITMPRPLQPSPEAVAVDVGRIAGRYERASQSIDVFDRGGVAIMRTTPTGPLAELLAESATEYELVSADASGTLFLVAQPRARTTSVVTFYSLPTGERYLHFGGRATPKVG